MDKSDRDATRALRALRAVDPYTASTALSETERLRRIFDDVEAALQSGVRRASVLETLHQNGFTITATSFKTALQRIRKERGRRDHGHEF